MINDETFRGNDKYSEHLKIQEQKRSDRGKNDTSSKMALVMKEDTKS